MPYAKKGGFLCHKVLLPKDKNIPIQDKKGCNPKEKTIFKL